MLPPVQTPRDTGFSTSGLPPKPGTHHKSLPSKDKRLAPYAGAPFGGIGGASGGVATPRKPSQSRQLAAMVPATGSSFPAHPSQSTASPRQQFHSAERLPDLSQHDYQGIPPHPPMQHHGHGRRSPGRRQRRPSPTRPRPCQLLQGLAANKDEVRAAYSTVDPVVAEELEAQARRLAWRTEGMHLEDASGMYVLIERCHSCQVHHALTTRHNEQQYVSLAENLLGYLRRAFPDILNGVDEFLCELDAAPRRLCTSYKLGKDIWHSASRLGAFEVYVLTPPPSRVPPGGGVLQFAPPNPHSLAVRRGQSVNAMDQMSSVTGGDSRFTAGDSRFTGLTSAIGDSLATDSVYTSNSANPGETWGAAMQLPGGYSALMLHSKLGSKAWPNEKQVANRLLRAIPSSVISIEVLCPSLLPLPFFNVEVREVSMAPHERAFRTQPLQASGKGTQGTCQVQGVPLETELEVKVSHPAMPAPQVVKCLVSRLKIPFTFGIDIVMCLWAVDVPGGLAIFASADRPIPNSIQERGRPFHGEVDMISGERLRVEGRVQLPWHGFKAHGAQPAEAFSSFRRFLVEGFHPGTLLPKMRRTTMTEVHKAECIEIALLAAPEALLQIVMPQSALPIADVQVVVETEEQRCITDARGSCVMTLRPGKHTIKLLHRTLAPHGVSKDVLINSMAGRLRLALPLTFNLWRAPVKVRGQTCAWKIWLATPGRESRSGDWEPFDCTLRWMKAAAPAQQGQEASQQRDQQRRWSRSGLAAPPPLEAKDGVLLLDEAGAAQLGGEELMPATGRLLNSMELAPPFTRYLEDEVDAAGSESAPVSSGSAASDPWRPHCMGIISEGPLIPNPGFSPALAVRARTGCCGTGVPGVQVSSSHEKLQGHTDERGCCALALPDGGQGEHRLQLRHSALPGGRVCCDVGPASQGATLEAPLFFEPLLYLYTAEVPADEAIAGSAPAAGRRAVYITPSAISVPMNAKPFEGEVTTTASREVSALDMVRGSAPEAGATNLRAYAMPAVSAGQPCPVTKVQVVPNEPGFVWRAVEPWPLASGPCALRQLLRTDKPMVLGILRPLATIVLTNGQTLAVPVDDCNTVALLSVFVSKHLGLPPGSQSLLFGVRAGAEAVAQVALTAFADEDKLMRRSGLRRMAETENVRPGQVIQVLVRLFVHVTFGQSSVAAPGAEVMVCSETGRSEATAGCTVDADGEAEIVVPPGSYTIVASHSHLGVQSLPLDVGLKAILRSVWLPLPATVCVYAMPPAKDEGPNAAVSVWVCAGGEDAVEHGAHPVAGLLEMRFADPGEEGGAQARLDAEVVRPVVLQPACKGCDRDQPAALDAATKAPAGGLQLQCDDPGKVWEPDAPWILEDLASWSALLEKPLRAGLLCAPVYVRLHGLGDYPDETLMLSSGSHRCAADICKAVAEKTSFSAANLMVYCFERLLQSHSTVQPQSTVDVWHISHVAVAVRTGCCQRGIADVNVRVTQDYHMSGESKSAPDDDDDDDIEEQDTPYGLHIGQTDESGVCKIQSNAGLHDVRLRHVLLESIEDAADGFKNVTVTMQPDMVCETEVLVTPQVVVFKVTQAAPPDEDGPPTFEVWASTGQTPDYGHKASPICGEMCFASGKVRLPLDGSSLKPKRVPQAAFNDKPGARCPVETMSVEAPAVDGLVWCPLEAQGDPKGCMFCAIAERPRQLGWLKPAVTLRFDDGRRGQRAIEDFGTLPGLRVLLAEELGQPAEEVGLFEEDGAMLSMAEEAAPAPGTVVCVGLLAPLRIRVLVPERPLDDTSNEALAALHDVLVEINGQPWQRTGPDGSCEAAARVGSWAARLVHPSFGTEGFRSVRLEVSKTSPNERLFYADVRIYIYATDPEVDEDEEPLEEGEAPLVTPSMLWLAVQRDQIPPEAVGIKGSVRAPLDDEREVSARLTPGSVGELMLLSGEKAAEVGEVPDTCSITAVQIKVQRPGFRWRAKDPSPLLEREQELGIGEYVRLMDCPVVVGFLDPTLTIKRENGPTIEVPLDGHQFVSDLLAKLSEDLGVSVESLSLLRDGQPLAESAILGAADDLQLLAPDPEDGAPSDEEADRPPAPPLGGASAGEPGPLYFTEPTGEDA